MEVPASLFEFLGGQVLLVGVLHVVKHEKECLLVKSVEIALPTVHGLSREVLLGLELWLVVEVDTLVHWQRLLRLNSFLILDQWDVQETGVKHIQESVLLSIVFCQVVVAVLLC